MCKTISTMPLTSARISFQNRACVTADFCLVYVILCCGTRLSLFVVNNNKIVWIPAFKITLKACFLIYFSSRNPKKSTELTEETLPVHNKSNIKLSTSICITLFILYIKETKANLKLIGNLIVSPDTWTVSMARYADWLDYSTSKLLD